MQDYKKGEKYLLQGNQLIPDTSSYYWANVANIGDLYNQMGDITKSLEYFTFAYRMSIDLDSYTKEKMLCKMGDLHCKLGNYNEAMKLYQCVADSAHFSLSNHGIHLRNTYFWAKSGLARVDIMKGELDSAIHRYERVINLYDIYSYKNKKEYITYLSELANLYYYSGKYKKADSLFLDVLEMENKVFNGKTLRFAEDLSTTGMIKMRLHNNICTENMIEAFSIFRNEYSNMTTFASAQQREKYLTILESYFDKRYPIFCYWQYQHDSKTSFLMYNVSLFQKGLLLNTDIQIQNSILESKDDKLIRKYRRLQAINEYINEQRSLEYSSPKEIDSLLNISQVLEKELVENSSAFRKSREQWNITWDSVRAHLTDHQLAIEYFTAPLNEDSTMYCALLLRNNSEYPELIPLFEEKEALPLINTSNEIFTNRTYGFRIANEDDAIGSDGAIAIGDTIGNGMKLSNLVWNKILPYIREGETVYFAPSGLLHQLSIEALPYNETHTMADMFNLVRLSSTREIVLHKDELKHTTATLYGGIQYNMSSDELLAESEQYSTTNLLASRGIENDTLNRGSVRYLPQTKTEVENINRMLKENNLQVQLYTSTNGNEESFKALSGKHQNILHIATHGFFWTDSTAHKKDYFSQRMLMMNDNMPQPPAIDPLNRCGLLFAGANTALQGHSNELPEGVQDGILTAKEISLLDLRDADLVVLSACETGKGEITGEGVFGLQRAFKQAGAQTIIMSLWPVNDAATQLLMTEFYKNWMTLHQPKRTAFRNAQKIVRQRYEDPAFWAGFIMLD